ncbi:MAG: DUF4293 domain-containing protein [Flavobacteriales bacterium]|nr:DUF4293 domain-containing protein [Flavobacteriales bacterium]MCB9174190.1 DUF4293 domain-containing protein [Flavobacteriales bacterium]
MIQRIQSVFLLLVFILGALMFVSPVLNFNSYEASFTMNAYTTFNASDHMVVSKNIGIGAMQGLIALLALTTIFLFKKRQLQIKLCKLNLLLIAVQIAALVLYIDVAKEAISPQNPGDVVLGLAFGFFIPILSFLLTYLAIWFIKKDEKLIRSADRLR